MILVLFYYISTLTAYYDFFKTSAKKKWLNLVGTNGVLFYILYITVLLNFAWSLRPQKNKAIGVWHGF